MKRSAVLVLVLTMVVLLAPTPDSTVEAAYHGGGGGGSYCSGGCVCNYCQFFLGCFCLMNSGSPCACEGVDGDAGCVLFGGGCGLVIVVSG